MIDWIAGALASTKTAADIAKSLMTLREEDVIRSRVFELNASLMELQQQMMTAQREQMALIDQVAELKEALRVTNAKSQVLDQYKLLSAGPGQVVYTLKDEFKEGQPPHFCCTNCYDDGKRSILKGAPSREGRMFFYCPGCKFQTYIGTAYIPEEMQNLHK